MSKEFSILNFNEYNSIENQYNVDFIKNSKCVKVFESNTIVRVCISEKNQRCEKLLENVHSPKKVEFIRVKDADFAEFIGSVVEKVKDDSCELQLKKQEQFSLEEISSDAPVVNIINSICLEAIRKNASDIHIHIRDDEVYVRFRIDGVLQTVKKLDLSIFNSLVSRIKVMSGLNIMENRMPQDGRMNVTFDNKNVDFRVSVAPAATGQSIVLRLFNCKKEILHLRDLGFSSDIYEKLLEAINIPFGLILATGPTGSGKTTTLHALLQEMDIEHLKIITIEDPVERIIPGVDQIQVNEEIGLTFDKILRRVLRQDPDVIMVGEIRDNVTADLAIRAALTGHVILSTLHTNDSISAVTRLKNLGVEPYLISSVLKYSLAQRLVRKICKTCNGCGCDSCSFTGYNGRSVVSELFEVSDLIAGEINNNSTDLGIRKILEKTSFRTLKEDAKLKCSAGITDIKELKREALV